MGNCPLYAMCYTGTFIQSCDSSQNKRLTINIYFWNLCYITHINNAQQIGDEGNNCLLLIVTSDNNYNFCFRSVKYYSH